MKKLSTNEWIAVFVVIVSISFFAWGDRVISLINSTGFGGENTEVVNHQTAIVPDQSGLVVQDIVVGTGEEARVGEILVVNYVGALTNGQIFDSSIARNQPFQFVLGSGSVIQGWELGLPGIRVGGKRRIIIPPSLAYGNRAIGPIPANSTLIFEVELLGLQDISQIQDEPVF